MRLVFPGSADKYNWFPICAFIPGLPGKTNEDTKESLDLFYALKDSKWVLVPTLFVPLEGTRPGISKAAKIFNLTDRWAVDILLHRWRCNLDFWRRERSTR